MKEAKTAIAKTNGVKLLEQKLGVDFAFVRPAPERKGDAGSTGAGGLRGRGVRKSGGGGRDRSRSRSPGVKRDGDRDEEKDMEGGADADADMEGGDRDET